MSRVKYFFVCKRCFEGGLPVKIILVPRISVLSEVFTYAILAVVETTGISSTIMERIASSSKSYNVKLMGVIEADEFYLKAGLKGRPYHGEILNSGRLPRHRGLKA
jgi:hypothetical protein